MANINYVVTKDFIVDIDGVNFLIKENTILLDHEYSNPDEDSITFKLLMGNNNEKYYDEYIVLDKHFIKDNMITFEEYQLQFSHLDLSQDYFGQVPTKTCASDFSVMENGETTHYEKIDEYMKKDGTKINAVKRKADQFSSNMSFFLDSEDSCPDREFAYFSMDATVSYHPNWGKRQEDTTFYPPQQYKLSIRFIQLPEMFDVVECFLTNQPLTDELQKFYDAYEELKYEMDNDGWGPGDSHIYHQYILSIQQKNELENKRAEVMQQIDRETALFRENLIAKRLRF